LGALGTQRWSSRKETNHIWISTGINNIPTALTIQKGMSRIKHFDHIFKTVTKVLGEGSILIFDCGAKHKKQIKNDSQWGH